MKHTTDFKPAARGIPGLHFPMPAIHRGRARTIDNFMTYDATTNDGYRVIDREGNQRGRTFDHAYTTHDGRTVDSTGAFMVGELERLDQTLHEPLASVTYGRDVPMREDVTIADEVSSFTVSTYASAGGLGSGQGIGTGKAWIGKVTNQVSGVGVDIAKVVQPLTPWGLEIKYTVMELESAAKIGRPIDQQKYSALQLKHQMDIDEQVYIGDTTLLQYGLVNSDNRTDLSDITNVANVANGAAGSPLWTQKSPDEILADVNEILVSTWAASAWAVFPGNLLIPPAQFGYISTTKVSNAGNVSILKYLLENNLLTASGVAKLSIFPSKWCIGSGVGGTIGTVGIDRMVCYTKDKERVRYPMTLLQRTPVQYDSIYQKTTYFAKLGVLETVYPETVSYRDGL